MRKLSDTEWITLTSTFVLRYKQGERPGEAYMNALKDMDYGLWESLAGTSADCFYNDANIKTFIRALNRGYISISCRWCYGYFNTSEAHFLGIYNTDGKRKNPEEHWICHKCNIDNLIVDDE